MRQSISVLCLAAVWIMLALGAGCEAKVSQANYEQITVGMSKFEVEQLLGSGTKDEGPAGMSISSAGIASTDKPNQSPLEVYIWKEGSSEIVVTFQDGKVVSKLSRNL